MTKIDINVILNKKEVANLEYVDVTEQVLNKEKKRYKIVKQNYYIDEFGNKYIVDNKYIIFELSEREIEVANILGELYGGEIRLVPRINKPLGIKTPDYIIKCEKFDLKEITGHGKYTIQGNIKGKSKQSNNFVIDITKSKLCPEEIKDQLERIYNSKHYLWLDKIILIKNNAIIKIYKRNK